MSSQESTAACADAASSPGLIFIGIIIQITIQLAVHMNQVGLIFAWSERASRNKQCGLA